MSTQHPIAVNLTAEMDRTQTTIAALAAAIGVGERQITRWRSGNEPRWHRVRQLERFFDRPEGWFYVWHDDQPAEAAA